MQRLIKCVKKGKKCDYFHNTRVESGENSDSFRWLSAVLYFMNIYGDFAN